MPNVWSRASLPDSRHSKPGWFKQHKKHATKVFTTTAETLLIGDSIVSGLTRYKKVWDNYFTNAINIGIRGDSTQHILWRVRNTRLSNSIKFVVVHCGTNNIDYNKPDDITNAIILIAEKLHLYHPTIKVILSGFLPRDTVTSLRREKIKKTNALLKERCSTISNVFYLEHSDWTTDDGNLTNGLYYDDNIHLIEKGNAKLAKEITNSIRKIRNEIDVVDKITSSRPISHSSHHLPPHQAQCALTPPIGGSNLLRWEKCEYVHHPIIPTTSSPPSLSLSSSSSPPLRRSGLSLPTLTSSPEPQNSGSCDDVSGGEDRCRRGVRWWG